VGDSFKWLRMKTVVKKTEGASSKKLQDARNKGNLPRSKDLSSALLLIVAAATLYGTGTLLAR